MGGIKSWGCNTKSMISPLFDLLRAAGAKILLFRILPHDFPLISERFNMFFKDFPKFCSKIWAPAWGGGNFPIWPKLGGDNKHWATLFIHRFNLYDLLPWVVTKNFPYFRVSISTQSCPLVLIF